MSRAADTADLAACIKACAQARDGRGRWRAVDRCAVGLAERSHNAWLCRAAAEAAGRIGAWLAAQPTVVSAAATCDSSGFAPGPVNAAARALLFTADAAGCMARSVFFLARAVPASTGST